MATTLTASASDMRASRAFIWGQPGSTKRGFGLC
jgi:hypothetical protein